MNKDRKIVKTAREGKVHIQVSVRGSGEVLEDAFAMTVESVRRVRRTLQKSGVADVTYIITKSGD